MSKNMLGNKRDFFKKIQIQVISLWNLLQMHKKSNIEIKNNSSDDNEDNYDYSDNMNIMKKEECNDNNHENNCKPIFLDNLIINNNIQLI